MMKRATVFRVAFAAIIFSAVYSAYADYSGIDKGTWPKSWPKELEPLRKQSRSLDGPEILLLHYHIPFTDRKQFESAWPHILKVITKGAPVILLRSPYTWLGRMEAGVIVHCPPAGTKPEIVPLGEGNNIYRLLRANYIELIVDGKVVDLNRIPLPADTPIIDKRFAERKEPPKSSSKSIAPKALGVSPAPPAAAAGGR
jgi:hypothetical protein